MCLGCLVKRVYLFLVVSSKMKKKPPTDLFSYQRVLSIPIDIPIPEYQCIIFVFILNN